MKRPYQITSVVLLLVSSYVAWESLKLGLHTRLGPGAGFFPFWVAVLIALPAAALFYQATFQHSDRPPEGFYSTRTGYLQMGAIVLAVTGTVVLMQPLGFRLTTLGFLLFLLFALGRQNPVTAGLVALAGSFGTYHLFVEWLDVLLPVGMLGI